MRAFFPNTPVSIAVVIILPFVGCAHEPRDATTTSQKRTQLSEEEISRCRQVAWETVNSPEMLERFKPERITQDPFEFRSESMSCYLNQQKFDKIEVAVPSGGTIGPRGIGHPCFLGVTMKRDTYEVLSMKEGYWP